MSANAPLYDRLDIARAQPRAAETPHPREHLRIAEPDVHRLPSAHREPGNGPLRTVRQRPVSAVDLRDQVLQHHVLERAAGRIAVLHHHNHRDRALRGDQIIQNEIRPTLRGPAAFALARAVLQIQYGIARRASAS